MATAASSKQASVRSKHQFSLRHRKTLAMEGVINVDSFDNEEVVIETDAGVLVIRGEDLHIKELNLETGTLQLTGLVHALQYMGEGFARKGRGVLGKLFK